MNRTSTCQRRRLRALAATWVLAMALLAAIAAGAAQASPPIKNAESRCLRWGGTFSMTANTYSCTGLSSDAARDSAGRQCLNAFKGVIFNFFPEGTSWRYDCTLSL
jgi:hypothetical protein